MDAAATPTELFNRFREVRLPENDIVQIEPHGEAQRSNGKFWLSLAAMLRPQHVFDATYYHCADQTYRYFLTHFDPTPPAWGNYGVLLQEWGRAAEAVRCHELALEIDPTYDRALANLAFCYEQIGDVPKARAYHERFESAEGVSAQSRTGLGNCFLLEGQLHEAVACFEEALRLDPNHADALFNAALALARLGSHHDAEEKIRRVLSSAPHDEAALSLASIIRAGSSVVENIPPMRPFERLSKRMTNFERYPSGRNQDGPWGWICRGVQSRPEVDKKKVFLSYRWGDDNHRKWVRQFAVDLGRRGYRVVLDQFAPFTDSSPEQYTSIVTQLANSAVFIPILDEGYRRRVEAVGDLDSETKTAVLLSAGRVFDEWVSAWLLASRSRISMLGVWRSGSVVPVPFVPEAVVDLRDDERYLSHLDRAFPRVGPETTLKAGSNYDEYPEVRGSEPHDATSGYPKDAFEAYIRLRVHDMQRAIITDLAHQAGRTSGLS